MAEGEQTRRGRSTPAVLYTWAGAIVALFALSALLSFIAVQTLSSTGDRIQMSTGPVLISTQGLVASIAEADAANTAVFLSGIDGGDEDVSQRRLYESAVARAPEQIEDISSGIGDNELTHDALKDVAQQLTAYAGVVEQARLSNANGLPGATGLLTDSLDLSGGANGMLANANEVTERTRNQFNDDVNAGRASVLIAVVALAATLLVLVIAQARLKKLTHRRISLGLVAASMCVLILGSWIGAAAVLRANDLSQATDEGFGDIAIAAQLQTAAFEYKTAETNAIIEEDASQLPDASIIDDIEIQLTTLANSADSQRERAQADAVRIRWQSYLETSNTIAGDVRSGNFDDARSLVAGEGNQRFTGFNTTAEALVLANQDQFNGSVANATARLNQLSFAAILLPLIGAVAAWLGYRPRINEYY